MRLALGVAWLAAAGWTPAGEWLGGWVARLSGGGSWGAGLYAAVLVAVWEILAWPVTGARIALVSTAAAAVAGTGIWMLGAMTPQWWWLVAGVVGGVALMGATTVAGLAVGRAAAVPLRRPDLVARLDALAVAVGGRRIPVRELMGAHDEAPSARVIGAGGAGVILLSPRLVADWPPDEVAVVVAHELAHVARHDLWRKAALDAAVLGASLGVAHLAAPGVGQTGNLGLVPVAGVVALCVWCLCRPVRLAQSRAHERAADRFALAQTGAPAALQAAVRRLAALHQVEERPSRLARWFFLRHPTIDERLALASAAVARPGRPDDPVSPHDRALP